MKKGKLIVIEGIDSSGKGTQLNLLKKKVEKQGKKVLSVDFPRYYTSPWGKMVGEFLTGKYGKFHLVHPHLAVFPYMIDQYTWCRDFGRPWLKKGGLVLLDRYFTSNVHQVAKLRTVAKRRYRDWLWKTGYDELGITKPDLVLFLDVDSSITRKLISGKAERGYLNGHKKDLAEKNWKHQVASYQEYLKMTREEKNWTAIRCVTNGVLDAPETIHERIWEVVKKYI